MKTQHLFIFIIFIELKTNMFFFKKSHFMTTNPIKMLLIWPLSYWSSC